MDGTKQVYRILAINPGSTSTKIGLFDNEACILELVVRHDREELLQCGGPGIFKQKNLRRELVLKALEDNHIPLQSLDAAVGRAGRLPPLRSGTYIVNDDLMADIPDPLEHPALLGTIIAKELGDRLEIPSFMVDPTVVDELIPVARITGLPEISRSTIFHALNQKAIARRYARENGREYEHCRLIIAHLGGGISVGAHLYGNVVDVNNASNGEGPYSPERAGAVPAIPLIEMCFSGKYTQKELEARFTKTGGTVAHLGTSDMRECEKRMRQGDKKAELVFDGMAFRVCKEIGAMFAVLDGNADAILITGGLAYSKEFIARILQKVSRIAPVHIYPGEDELLALAQGAYRVLSNQEKAQTYVRKNSP